MLPTGPVASLCLAGKLRGKMQSSMAAVAQRVNLGAGLGSVSRPSQARSLCEVNHPCLRCYVARDSRSASCFRLFRDVSVSQCLLEMPPDELALMKDSCNRCAYRRLLLPDLQSGFRRSLVDMTKRCILQAGPQFQGGAHSCRGVPNAGKPICCICGTCL